jgi:hypothetical protein
MGIMMYISGLLYEGDWKNGKREGCGRLIDNEGDTYEGQWVDNQPHGDGTY